MGEKQEPNFYDKRLERVSLPLEESPWKDVYESAASLLPSPAMCPKIADIGCGTGRFAKLLHQLGYTEYMGIDFSPARIREAKEYVPEFKFLVGDMFDKSFQRIFPDFNVFIILEVLEHIESDFKLLKRIPSGALIIFSVPNYDSAGHIRYFTDQESVLRRYSKYLDFSMEQRVLLPRKKQGKYIFLFCCFKH